MIKVYNQPNGSCIHVLYMYQKVVGLFVPYAHAQHCITVYIVKILIL